MASLLRFDSFQVGAFSDDAHYIVLAEGLATRQGFRLVSFPNPPTERSFPPGWPILLSSFVFLFPGNYEILKLLSFIFWLASIPLIYKLFAKRIETPYLEILIALIVLNPIMIGASSMVMAEAAYLFFSLLTLYLFERWDRHQNGTWSWLPVVAITIIALYAQLIRTVGLSILLTLIVYLLLSRRLYHAMIVGGIFFLGLLPQFWFNSQSDGSFVSSGYEAQVFNDSVITKLGQAWVNIHIYLKEMIANSLVPIFGPQVASALDRFGLGMTSVFANVFILLLIAIGVVLSLKRPRISDLYVLFYFLGILSFWNPVVGSAQMRFLIPIIPFLYFYLLQGLIWIVQMTIKIGKRISSHTEGLHGRRALNITNSTVVGLSCLLITILLMRNIQDWQNPARNKITDLSIGTTWINENAPLTSVVMARDPVSDYLYTRRKTIAYPKTDEQDVEEYIKANNIDYIIISPKLQTPRSNELDDYVKTHLLPAFAKQPNRFRIVYTNPMHNVAVYEYHILE